MAKEHHVYAKCSGRKEPYLQTQFTGTRAACDKYIRDRVRNGQPTHFLFISTLDLDAAARRYLD